MRLLLDTHTVLWMFRTPEKITQIASALLRDSANSLYVSVASAWEIAIKFSLAKLDYEGGMERFLSTINSSDIELLPINPDYLTAVQKLPFYHRDPFDRLLVATAQTENITLVSADENIRKYEVQVVW